MRNLILSHRFARTAYIIGMAFAGVLSDLPWAVIFTGLLIAEEIAEHGIRP